ncbi:MAG: pantoate--beta-alanine ligase [Ktedonobacteraceae bacterium]|nr:pantoate--beta-alanine ligase [Ktedonobacteraceae bacterium]
MQIISTIQDLVYARTQWSGPVGFVPTMGYLHEGHLALYRSARTESQTLIGSIFVNPIQFAPHEDLNRYPRDLERDLSTLESIGVDVVFTPSTETMYPSDFTTYVVPEGPLATQAEGATRPGHFRGVATVVLKLFQLVQPDIVYFGQKDAQQTAVITHMIQDFNMPIKLRALPTVREADGLAMSSRNSYLAPPQREAATILYQALQAGRAAIETHPQSSPAEVVQAMKDVLAREPQVRLDYAEIRDARTFLQLEVLQPPALLLIAAWIGQTRLIDNFVFQADGSWNTGQFAGHSSSRT